jgi:4a-hydroxytetrahydrobiopterin dehydratase
MTALKDMKCIPCRGGEPPLTEQQINELKPQIVDWTVKEVEGVQRLERIFKFRNFSEAVEFTDRVAAIAEADDHHPLIITEWGRVTVQWWTHKIKGLHHNDFIMASKTDGLLSE